jgi:cytochrome c oxidase subunit III
VVNRRVKRTTFMERLEGNSFFWLIATAVLGTVFLMCQAYEFTSFVHEGLGLTTNLFSSSFFVLTGFHGAHVTAGVLWLCTLASIDKKRGLREDEGLVVDMCALYWHFVDVVWIAIFVLLYLIK